MTTTEAITAARHEITMHRQGSGWYVNSPYCDSWWASHVMSYAMARERVRRLRVRRALDLLGCDDDTVIQAIDSGRCLEAAVRGAVRQ